MSKQAIEIAKEKAGHWIEEGTAAKGWYTCIKTGKKFRGADAEALLGVQDSMIEEAEEMLARQAETEIESEEEAARWMAEVEADVATPTQAAAEVASDDPRITQRLAIHLVTAPKRPKTTTIRCCDCGGERVIKLQDVFQVRRCVPCQKEYAKARRRARHKATK